MNEVRPKEKRLWKVNVLCEGMSRELGAKDRLIRAHTDILVSAIDASAAMESARAYAESRANCATKWKLFTPLSTALVKIPSAIEELS